MTNLTEILSKHLYNLDNEMSKHGVHVDIAVELVTSESNFLRLIHDFSSPLRNFMQDMSLRTLQDSALLKGEINFSLYLPSAKIAHITLLRKDEE